MLLLLDANGALLAAALGLLLIFAEFCLPGWVFPGVAGGVCLLCGAYRLSILDADPAAAAALGAAVVLAAISGYGMAPEWLGVAAVLAIPWLCRLLVPGSIAWPSAALGALPAAVAFGLLRVAARAADNKTFIQ